MKQPNISVPIDHQLDRRIKGAVKRSKLSRADVVRQILRQHFGLLKRGAA